MEIDELPLVGGHAALDLVNTVERGTPAAGGGPADHPADHLAGPSELLRWARRVGLVDDAEARVVADGWERDPGSGRAALAAVREVREALHVALLAVMGVDPAGDRADAALERLRDRWAAATARSRLALDAEGAAAARLTVGTEPASLIADRVAVGAVELLGHADRARLRRCPPDAGGCGWVFLDRSRNGSRRWCRMADCGTTVKARRLTERRRAARAR